MYKYTCVIRLRIYIHNDNQMMCCMTLIVPYNRTDLEDARTYYYISMLIWHIIECHWIVFDKWFSTLWLYLCGYGIALPLYRHTSLKRICITFISQFIVQHSHLCYLVWYAQTAVIHPQPMALQIHPPEPRLMKLLQFRVIPDIRSVDLPPWYA